MLSDQTGVGSAIDPEGNDVARLTSRWVMHLKCVAGKELDNGGAAADNSVPLDARRRKDEPGEDDARFERRKIHCDGHRNAQIRCR